MHLELYGYWVMLRKIVENQAVSQEQHPLSRIKASFKPRKYNIFLQNYC